MTLREQFKKETGKDAESAISIVDYVVWLEKKLCKHENINGKECLDCGYSFLAENQPKKTISPELNKKLWQNAFEHLNYK